MVGATAGFMNVPKIKGTHTAMKSGMLDDHCTRRNRALTCSVAMLAAEATAEALLSDTPQTSPIDLSVYEAKLKASWVYSELKEVRNIRPSFHSPLGMWGGILYSGIDTLFLKGRVPWTFPHVKPDHACLKPAAECKEIEYPKPDGKISFDLLTNLSRSGTNHEEDQPVHLTLADPAIPKELNWKTYAGPESRYCPGML